MRLVPINFLDDCLDLAVTPAAVATMPITNLQTNVRGDVWRSTSLAAQAITGTFNGNAREISHWSIWPADGSSLIGSLVRVRFWSDVAKTTLVYDSGTLDFFTFTGTAYNVFLYGVQSWGVDNADRTARLAPKAAWFAPVVVAAFQVDITNAGGVDAGYFESRRVFLGDYVEAPYGPNSGMQPAWKTNSQQSRSVGGSLRRSRRALWRELPLDVVFETEADRSAWADLIYVCDTSREIVISVFPGDATEKRERDFTILGSLSALNPMVFQAQEFHTLQLAVVES